MTEEQELVTPVLSEELVLQCIEESCYEPIREIVDNSPIDAQSTLPIHIRMNNPSKKVELKEGGSMVLNLNLPYCLLVPMIESNYLKALRAYMIKHKDSPVLGKRMKSALLCIAAEAGNEAAVKLLLEMGADRFVASDDGSLPLHLAVRKGHAHLIKPLVSPLKESSAHEIKMIKKLLATPDKNGRIPLHSAIEDFYIKTVNQLEEYYMEEADFSQPFDEKAALKSLKKLKEIKNSFTGTEARKDIGVMQQLFQVGATDPSRKPWLGKSILERAINIGVFQAEYVFHPDTRKKLHEFLQKSFLQPCIMRLYSEANCSTALFSGLHGRVGAKSLLKQLERRSSLYKNP